MRRSEAARAGADSLLARGVAQHIRSFRNLPWDVYAVKPGSEPAFTDTLRRAGAELHRPGTLRLAAVPNDPRFANQTEIASPSSDADIFLKEAWNITTGTQEIVVAIIDSGISGSHPDLLPNLWVNAAEAAGTPGIDDDGNGLVDDLHGWDFTANSGALADTQGHGTQVAGVVAAVGNNALGVAGTGWRTRLMILRAFDAQTADELDILDAFDYVLDHPEVRIINASWGDTLASQPMRDACVILRNAGILLVTAAGNDNANLDVTPYWPASYTDLDNIVSVAAIDQAGARASFSSYGSGVSLAAPGFQVETTSLGGTYTKVNGTSFAAPRVAGAAALFFSLYPGATPSVARQRLIETSRFTTPLASVPLLGGLLNVEALLQPIPAAAREWRAYP